MKATSKQTQLCQRSAIQALAGMVLATAVVRADTLPFSDVKEFSTPDLRTRKTGHDWPTFLGPEMNGKSKEKGIITKWPKTGPRLVWYRRLTESYGIGSVSRGRYFQFDRVKNKGQLDCLNAETGKLIWTYSYDYQYRDMYGYNSGPRCSPIVDGDHVYILGVAGQLHCVRVEDGKRVWAVDTTDFGVIQNFFGVGSNPVIYQDTILVMVGGSPAEDKDIPPGELDRVTGNGSGIVAFDKKTGKVRYKLSDELASYSSLVLSKGKDRDWCFAFCRGGLLAFDPSKGKQDFHFPWRSPKLESVNASAPVVSNGKVLISETYGPGSALMEFERGNPTVVWQDDRRKREKSMQAHWNTPVLHDGFVYGCSGRHSHNAELRCVRWSDGKVMWSEPGLTRSSLTYVDNHFVCLSEDGALRLIKANPKKYDVVAEVILPRAKDDPKPNGPMLSYPAWSAPILAHGLLYVRGDDRLACLELIPAK